MTFIHSLKQTHVKQFVLFMVLLLAIILAIGVATGKRTNAIKFNENTPAISVEKGFKQEVAGKEWSKTPVYVSLHVDTDKAVSFKSVQGKAVLKLKGKVIEGNFEQLGYAWSD